MDLTRWNRLFDLDDSLEPAMLRYRDDLWWIGNYSLADDELHIAAALIRDAAVWWLLDESRGTGHLDLLSPSADGGVYVIGNSLGQLGGSNDRTEAVYLACCLVLGVEP